MTRIITTLAFALGLLASSRSASAQATRVAVVPWSVVGSEEAAPRATEIRAALPSGFTALSADQALSRFTTVVSSDPPTVSDSEVDRWLALSRDAVRALANADYASARASLVQAQLLSDRAAAELNREEARARQVLDTCLFGVRAYIETSDPGADAAATECRRLVPRIAPSPHIHTPEVVELLGRVDRRLAAGQPATLTVESDPSDCVARVNGVVFGHTPLTTSDLPPGEYRIQVECAGFGHGRMHRVTLGAEPATVRVDARFDGDVRTAGGLALTYASEEAASASRVADAASIGVALGVDEIWLVSGDAAERLHVADGRVLAWVTGAADRATAEIVLALSEGRQVGEAPSTTGHAEGAMVARGDDVATSTTASDRGVDPVPWILVGAVDSRGRRRGRRHRWWCPDRRGRPGLQRDRRARDLGAHVRASARATERRRAARRRRYRRGVRRRRAGHRWDGLGARCGGGADAQVALRVAPARLELTGTF